MIVRTSSFMTWTEWNIKGTPNVTGVYLLYDWFGSVSYAGYAGVNRLKDRLLEHWTSNDIPMVRGFAWMQLQTEAEAKVLESKLIARFQPYYNKKQILL